jgi:asparagine synthase (glutamine-hydrolysing)
MCGISGFISKKKIEDKVINQLKNLMVNRGPDFQDKFEIKEKNHICFLHSRLSIIDLNERSNQPFKNKNHILSFNGEIYNFLEIKKELEKKGNKFLTKGDTEVFIKSFIDEGASCFKNFDGMWAASIYNKKDKILYLSRDPFGEKPLYYYRDHEIFIFGSEIKYIIHILKHLDKKIIKNEKKINDYLFNGYKSLKKNNETFFKNIFCINPGSYLKFTSFNNIIFEDYRDLNFKNLKPFKSISESIHHIKEDLIESIKLRLRSDVPVAFCLSGGIDSGGIISIAKKILNKKLTTFSIIDNDERYNETKNIDLICKNLNIDNYKINISNYKNDFLENISNLINFHDSPISTPSYYIQSFLMREIKSKNFKVSISGTGADELFTGYYDHYLQYFQYMKSIKKNYKKNLTDWKEYILPKIRNKNLKDKNFYIRDINNRKNIYEEQFNLKRYSKQKKYEKFKEKNFSTELIRNRMLNELFYEVVPVILLHDDHNAMRYSVENRSPYLSMKLLNSSLRIPTEYLIQNGYQKYILREALKGVLDDKIRLDRTKKGFNASLASFFDLNNKDNLDYLFNENCEISDLVDLKKLKRNFKNNYLQNHYSKFIFGILNVKIFLDKY